MARAGGLFRIRFRNSMVVANFCLSLTTATSQNETLLITDSSRLIRRERPR